MRTRGPEHEDKRRKILKTARGLVLRSGHAKLSLREVARRAGFSPASLYEYFDSKDAIVSVLSLEAMASLGLAMRAAARDEGDARATVVAIAVAYIAWGKQHPEDYKLLFERLPSRRRSLSQAPSADSPYRILLEAVQRALGERAAAADTLAYGLWASAHGMVMLQLTHLAGFDVDFVSSDRALLAALVAGFEG